MNANHDFIATLDRPRVLRMNEQSLARFRRLHAWESDTTPGGVSPLRLLELLTYCAAKEFAPATSRREISRTVAAAFCAVLPADFESLRRVPACVLRFRARQARRGIGSGANYAEVNRQTNTILGEIKQLLPRGLARGVTSPQNAD